MQKSQQEGYYIILRNGEKYIEKTNVDCKVNEQGPFYNVKDNEGTLYRTVTPGADGWTFASNKAEVCSVRSVGGKAPKKVTTPKGERTVRKGPRGGEYVIYNNKKVPASRFEKKKK